MGQLINNIYILKITLRYRKNAGLPIEDHLV